MNRFDKCISWTGVEVCGHVRSKHDDNGECRVKSCDCLDFLPARVNRPELVETVYRTDIVA